MHPLTQRLGRCPWAHRLSNMSQQAAAFCSASCSDSGPRFRGWQPEAGLTAEMFVWDVIGGILGLTLSMWRLRAF